MFHPWVGKIPQRRAWQPTPVFMPGESHGQRNLAGYSPLGCKRVRHDFLTKEQQHRHHKACPSLPTRTRSASSLSPAHLPLCCCRSVTKSSSALCDLMNYRALPSFTISQSLFKLMSKSLMPSNHLILCRPLSPCPQSFPASGSFPIGSSSHQVAKVSELQLQHQSFQ